MAVDVTALACVECRCHTCLLAESQPHCVIYHHRIEQKIYFLILSEYCLTRFTKIFNGHSGSRAFHLAKSPQFYIFLKIWILFNRRTPENVILIK